MPAHRPNVLPCVIIIGGTSGIGLALAKRHVHLGWQVIVVGSRADKISYINDQHPDIQTLRCDITHTQQRQQLLAQLSVNRFERLIYCAGWYLNERVLTLTLADSNRMLAINLQAFNQIFDWASTQLKLQSTYHTQDKMVQPNSSLVCLSSVAGIMKYPYASLYAKCKHAMIATSSAYRLGLAPYNIQVSCIALGYVNTQTLRALNDGDASHKPFIMSEEVAVNYIMQTIKANVELAVYPKQMRLLTQALSKLPTPLLKWVMRKKLDKN